MSYDELREDCYDDVHVVAVCYDVTSKDSFSKLGTWIEEIKSRGYDGLPIILVGLKSDRNRAINEREVAAFARSKGIKFVETSAKEGKNL